MEPRRNIPPVSTAMLAATLGIGIGSNFGWLSPYDLHFSPRLVARGQAWRLVTSYLYFGEVDIYWLINVYQDFIDLYRLERGNYGGKRADFVALLLVCWACTLLYAWASRAVFPGRAFFSAVNYVWCRLNPDFRVGLFGVAAIPTSIWPVVRVALFWLLGRPLRDLVVGILVGHMYYFSEEVFPKIHQGRRPVHEATRWVLGRFSAARGLLRRARRAR